MKNIVLAFACLVIPAPSFGQIAFQIQSNQMPANTVDWEGAFANPISFSTAFAMRNALHQKANVSHRLAAPAPGELARINSIYRWPQNDKHPSGTFELTRVLRVSGSIGEAESQWTGADWPDCLLTDTFVIRAIDIESGSFELLGCDNWTAGRVRVSEFLHKGHIPSYDRRPISGVAQGFVFTNGEGAGIQVTFTRPTATILVIHDIDKQPQWCHIRAQYPASPGAQCYKLQTIKVPEERP